MRIAITGAHSQGKTTLMNDLKTRPELRDFSFLGNITRGIKDLGVEINEGGSDWSQSLVLAKHIEHFFARGNTVLDRCILDGVVYTGVLKEDQKVSKEVMFYANFVFEQLIKKYDYLFYVVPELPLAVDSTRSTDRIFFNDVVDMFERYINAYNVPVIRIRGSREERVNAIINTVKDKLN